MTKKAIQQMVCEHRFAVIIERCIRDIPIKRVRCETCGRHFIDAILLGEGRMPHIPSLDADFARALGERPSVSVDGCGDRIAELLTEITSHVMNLRAACDLLAEQEAP